MRHVFCFCCFMKINSLILYWFVLDAGKLKLNTDGCSKGVPGQERYGGLLRDVAGTWLWGYYGKIGHCTSLEMELWAIYRGLTILLQKGTKDVKIESDSKQAINQILHGPNQNSPYKALIEDAKFLLQRCNCSFGRTLREGNKVDDQLANMGVVHDEHENLPDEVRSSIIDDMAGVSVIYEGLALWFVVVDSLNSCFL